MKLFDSLIKKIEELCDGKPTRHYIYDGDGAWPEHENHEMILQKDTAYELGSIGHNAVNITCVTGDTSLFGELKNETILYGDELRDIAKDRSYARISLIYSDNIPENTDDAYQALQDIDFVKYHVFPEGYMIRTSGQTCREQVRVGKKALANGISFEGIGNTFIEHYLQLKEVRYAKVIFFTAEDIPYSELEKLGNQAFDIKSSLSAIKNGLPTECSICDIKDICNEVEGLRELHFGSKKRQPRA